MTNFSIKDLSDFSGIKQHTIRIWEQRFNFLQPKRSEAYRRLYSVEQLNVFLDATLLNKSGYKVSRIARMSPDEKNLLVAKMDLGQQQLKAINDLIIYMAEMDHEGFEQVLDRCIASFGIHETIAKIIIPFSERVGLFQKIDGKSYIENIAVIRDALKRKMHLGIDQVRSHKKQLKSVLLFLPPGEQQDLSLLYLHYLLKMEGYSVINLGNCLGTDILESVCKEKRPDYIITHLLEKSNRKDLTVLVDELAVVLPQTVFIAIGNGLPVKNQANYRHPEKLQDIFSVII